MKALRAIFNIGIYFMMKLAERTSEEHRRLAFVIHLLYYLPDLDSMPFHLKEATFQNV